MPEKSNVPIRICGSKVRSGCRTCKQRHVKCDEEKPVCWKCQKGGRECIYDSSSESQTPQRQASPPHDSASAFTTVLTHRNKPWVVLPDSVNPHGSRDPTEVIAVNYFALELGKDLAGHFSDEVWCRVFPRIAQHEPAIWHATVAVGMLDTSMRLDNDPWGSAERNVSAAIKHYSKAIRELNTRLESVDTASCRDVVLLSCLLFAIFECLQNNTVLALRHISGGTKLLMEWSNSVEGETSETSSGLYLDRRALQPAFFVLDSQAVQMGVVGFRDYTSLPAIKDKHNSSPKTFSSIDEANLSLNSFFNRLSRWAHWVPPCVALGPGPDITWMALEQQILKDKCTEWDSAFASLPQHLRDEQAAGMLLQVQRTVIQIFFQKCVDGPGEMEFDKSLHLFERAVEYAEQYFELTKQTSQEYAQRPRVGRRVFTVAMDIVMSLFIIGAKCRIGPLRRRALSLLQTCNRKEGIWDSRRCGWVVGRIIEIEERGALEDGFIPESARIFELDLHLNEEKGGEIVHKRKVKDEDGNDEILTHAEAIGE